MTGPTPGCVIRRRASASWLTRRFHCLIQRLDPLLQTIQQEQQIRAPFRNRLKLDEIQGGTFTLNNTGALGAVMTQAIINQPQAAILTMDAVVKRAVVVDDMIAIRPIMNLGLSFDHRLNDGLQAARFLQDVRAQLEGLDEGATLL